jgi:acyl-CoA oxidase
MDPYDAFLECQTHLLALARAHVEAEIASAFRHAAESCDDDALRPVLELVRDLSALVNLERDRGWFLEQGYFEGAKAEAIRSLVEELCAEVRRHALGLVDAFAIPDAVLAAPIGTRDRGATSTP